MADDSADRATRLSTVAFLTRLVASIAVPLVLIGAVLWWLVSREQVHQAVDSQSVVVAQLMELALEDALALDQDGVAVVNDAASIDDRIVELIEPVLGAGIGVRIVGLDGVAVYSTTSAEVGEITGMGDISPAALRGVASGLGGDAAATQPVVYSVPVAIDGVTVAAARVAIPDDVVVAAAAESASRLRYLFAGALVAMFVALVPLSWWSLGEVRRQYRKTRILAMSDNLTGLANRTQFHQRLDEAIAGAQRSDDHVGLVMLDLDGFKAINDLGGHAAGDRLLRRVAAALGSATRRNEVACRLGGDEFAVVAPRIKSRGELRQLADRLHEELDIYVDFSDGRRLRVTASLGLALYPDDARTGDDLLHVADVGMYTVKASRKAKLPAEARERAAAPD